MEIPASLDDLQSQLDFYRQKVSQQEQERYEWQAISDEMRSQIERIHQSESDAMGVKEQIAEIQKALSDSHLAIYDEKNYNLQLQRDYEMLAEQDRSNKKKMQEIANMENDIKRMREEAERQPLKNYKDVRPQALAKQAIAKAKKEGRPLSSLKPKQPVQNVMTNALIAEKLNEEQEKASDENKNNSNDKKRPQTASAKKQGPGGGIVKTIVLPNEDLQRLKYDCENLYNVLKAQESLFHDTVSGYQKDRCVRQQEFDNKERDINEKVQVLEARLQASKDLNYKLSTEYFNYRNQTNEVRKTLQDQIDLAKIESQELANQLEQQLVNDEQDANYSDNLYENKTRQFANRMRKQAKKNEEESNIIKVQFAQATEEYLKQLQDKKKQLEKVIKRGEEVQRHRTNEQGTFLGDLQTLKKRVTSYEQHIKRLKQLVDKEDTEALVMELQRSSEVDLPDLDQIIDELAQVNEQVGYARRKRI